MPKFPVRPASFVDAADSALKKRINVVLTHCQKTMGPHSRQIFVGFGELAAAGAIRLDLRNEDWNPAYGTQNLIKARLEDEIDILFDTNDGFYWLHEDLERNIDYFALEILPRFSYVFKRSCNPEMIRRFGEAGRKFHPLGLNYDVSSRNDPLDRFYSGCGDWLRKMVKRSPLLCRILGKTSNADLDYRLFEASPLIGVKRGDARVLFLTRLWDPEAEDLLGAAPEVRTLVAADRERINAFRISCLEACRAEFPGNFIGGLAPTPYAQQMAPHLVMPSALTAKKNFMRLVKDSTVCVATAGLHQSTGWRFAEYIAASRAIVSEPLFDVLPGHFTIGRNYLEFRSSAELVSAIRSLLSDPHLRLSMMWNNYIYYLSHVRPDNLVMNALHAALVNSAAGDALSHGGVVSS